MLKQITIDNYLQHLNQLPFNFSLTGTLLEYVGVTSYGYGRLYHDNRLLMLHQGLAIVESSLEHLDSEQIKVAKNLYQKYPWVLWSDLNMKDTPFIQYLKSQDLINNCSILIAEKDYIEIHEFYGSYQYSHLDRFYTYQKPLLYSFINHFKVNNISFIEQLVSKAIPLNINEVVVSESLLDERKLHNFKTHLTGTKAITHEGQSYLLSKREYQALQYLQKGWSLKAIAKYCGISPRTVETYLNRIKYKLGVNSKSPLFEIDTKI